MLIVKFIITVVRRFERGSKLARPALDAWREPRMYAARYNERGTGFYLPFPIPSGKHI